MNSIAPDNRPYLAYDEWFAELYPNWYGKLMDENKGPYRPLRVLLDSLPGLARRAPGSIEILDVACGTGATFIPLTRHGYRAWGSDGSRQMLRQAVMNCAEAKVSKARLNRHPIDWRDAEGFRKSHGKRVFDVVIAMSNSLCHLPLVPGQLDVALANFRALLKPGGRLIVDTKKFARGETVEGVTMLHELEFKQPVWIERTTRPDPGHLPPFGDVTFHTSMHYDRDPAFGACRALVTVTVHGPRAAPHARLLTYYPLPQDALNEALVRAGFETTWHAAKTEPLDWSYDLAVATRA